MNIFSKADKRATLSLPFRKIEARPAALVPTLSTRELKRIVLGMLG